MSFSHRRRELSSYAGKTSMKELGCASAQEKNGSHVMSGVTMRSALIPWSKPDF